MDPAPNPVISKYALDAFATANPGSAQGCAAVEDREQGLSSPMEIFGPLNYRDERAAFPGAWSLWVEGLKCRTATVWMVRLVLMFLQDPFWDEVGSG